ncbi:OmpP1/FadL family transporter [Chitinophaga eiseniae]|uniref:Outer membrane protein transport protein (OMPP1/FadL/TodX) n=1 Tax=Chitinophaga eiseniae TaxID=634771 RepID=A0A847SMJ0_9BACT|nr:outer membrane protein transport protein [Chitinophaga eiseniae]NLR80445.1 hypothetical protein [Chitinophaga eiseniae]
MIKRLYPLLGGLFISATALAQSSNDALLYSPLQPHGTARTQALGGAGVGLGGDYSSAHINPAGIAVFKTGEFLISGAVNINNNTSTWLPNPNGDKTTGNRSNFQVPNIGVIFATNKNSGRSTWNNITFSLGMDRLANYNNQIAIAGRNSNSSYSDSWVDDIFSGNKATQALGTDLGFSTGLIADFQPTGGGSKEPMSLASPKRQIGNLPSVDQRGTLKTEGGLNEYVFAIGGNYGDRLYIGASLNLPSINYKESLTWSEDDVSKAPNNNFSYFDYYKNLKRTGLGIGGKVGILYKVTDRFRVGGTFVTPTFYSLHDAITSELYSDVEDGKKEVSAFSVDQTNGYAVESDYNFTAPLRAAAGASYFFGNLQDPRSTQGFITADYEFVNQASGKFRMSDDKGTQNLLNNNINAIYRSTSNLRAGAELKFMSMYAVRAGFAWYANPYSNDAYNAGIDASRKVYSGGVGFRNKGFYADATYSYTQGNDRYQPYTVYEASLSPKAASLDYTRSNIMLTIGLKF